MAPMVGPAITPHSPPKKPYGFSIPLIWGNMTSALSVGQVSCHSFAPSRVMGPYSGPGSPVRMVTHRSSPASSFSLMSATLVVSPR